MIRMKEGRKNFTYEMNLSKSDRMELKDINEQFVREVMEKNSMKGYVIVSPCCGYKEAGITPCDKDAMQKLSDLNMSHIIEMMEIARENKFCYTPLFGRFTHGEEDVYEVAFIIYPYFSPDKAHTFEELQAFAIELAKKFNQERILSKAPENSPMYLTKEGNEEYIIGKKEDAIADLAERIFTDLHRHNMNDAAEYAGAYRNPGPRSLTDCYVRGRKGEKFTRYC